MVARVAADPKRDSVEAAPIASSGSSARGTPPAISGISHFWAGKNLKVSFTTDEPATGEVCDDNGLCTTTTLGTSHMATFKSKGSSYTITATDAAGNVAIAGPFASQRPPTPPSLPPHRPALLAGMTPDGDNLRLP